MLLIFTIMMLGSILGYYLAKKRNGKFLDKLQYIAVFGIIFLLAMIIQIIIMNLVFFDVCKFFFRLKKICVPVSIRNF